MRVMRATKSYYRRLMTGNIPKPHVLMRETPAGSRYRGATPIWTGPWRRDQFNAFADLHDHLAEVARYHATMQEEQS